MAVQGQDKGSVLCDKCFAMVNGSAEFCPECGAPLRGGSTDASDSAVYPDLAKANLLRMRGEYKKAEEACLSILRKYPNNASANTLLGDIYAAQGDWEQAREWYELALDITPDSESLQHKLEQVRGKHTEVETASTAEILGLPTQKPKTGIAAVVVALLIIAIGIGAYFASQRGKTVAVPNPNANLPVVLNPPIQPAPTPDHTQSPEPTPGVTKEDQELTKLIAALPGGEHLILAQFEPQTQSILVTYGLKEGDDERAIGAHLGGSALEPASEHFKRDLRGVDIRAVRDKQIVFGARITRSAMELVESKEWQDAHRDDEKAYTKAVLADEWTPEDNKTASADTAGTVNSPQASTAATSTAQDTAPKPAGTDSTPAPRPSPPTTGN